jgi:hypothetical protein
LAWEGPGAHLYFHYAPRDYAAQIAEEARFVVSDRPHQQYGFGLFATNIEPGSMNDQRLLVELFSYQRDVEAVEGVVVLADMDFQRVGRSVFLLRRPGGTVIDLTEALVGFGIRMRTTWTFSRGCYRPANI